MCKRSLVGTAGPNLLVIEDGKIIQNVTKHNGLATCFDMYEHSIATGSYDTIVHLW